MSTILLILIIFAVLSILILVHEFGHFLAAKKAGVWVEEFGIGLPPKIWGKQIGETEYSINALPIGGFVRLHGENPEQEITQPERALLNKPRWVQILIVLAGIGMNFLLGVVSFAIVYSFTGIVRDTGQIRVVEVKESSPAQIRGILVGDVILKVDDQEVKKTADFVSLIEAKKGQRVKLEIRRETKEESEIVKLTLTPRLDPPEGEGALGVVISTSELYFPPWWQRPFLGAFYGFQDALFLSRLIVQGFAAIFKDVSQGQAPEGVAGPVGIAALIGYASKQGILPLINFLGIVSVNLVILNLVPFPPLDGSRVVFIFATAIFGRKILPKIEEWAYKIGFAILIALLILVTIKEIPALIRAGSLNKFVENLLPTP